MIKEVVSQILEGANLGLTGGTNLFVDMGKGSPHVLITTLRASFPLDAGTVMRESEVQVLLRGYSHASGDRLADSILSALNGLSGSYTVGGVTVVVKELVAAYTSNYRNPETKEREVSLNFAATYCKGA